MKIGFEFAAGVRRLDGRNAYDGDPDSVDIDGVGGADCVVPFG